MHNVYELLNKGIKSPCHDSRVISLSSISDAISKLKCNKLDGVHVLLSDSDSEHFQDFSRTNYTGFKGNKS